MNVSKILKKEFTSTQTGTPYYASPEVWREEAYNSKADIWSLGCVVFELCNLKHPFKAHNLDLLFTKVQNRTIGDFNESYSNELRNVIDLCLTSDYLKRPSAKTLMKHTIFYTVTKTHNSTSSQKILSNNISEKIKSQKDIKKIKKYENNMLIQIAKPEWSSSKRIIRRYPKLRRKESYTNLSSCKSVESFCIIDTIPVINIELKELAKNLPKPCYS